METPTFPLIPFLRPICLLPYKSHLETSPDRPLWCQIIKGRECKYETFGSKEPDLAQESWCLLRFSKNRHANSLCFRLSSSHLSYLEPFLQHWNQKPQVFSFLPVHTSLLAEFQNILQAHGLGNKKMCNIWVLHWMCTQAKLFSKVKGV